LHNLAVIYGLLGNYREAAALSSKCLAIEPSVRTYYEAAVAHLSRDGRLRDALLAVGKLRAAFPYAHECDEIAIRLHLGCGDPSRAVAALREAVLDSAARDSIRAAIVDADAAKRDADNLSSLAERELLGGGVGRAGELLERAAALNSSDPLIQMNLAFMARRGGDYERCLTLLVRAVQSVRYGLVKVCLFNGAVAAYEEGKAALAAELLEDTVKQLSDETGGMDQTRLDSLPGLGIWVSSEGIIEELPESATRAVVAIVGSDPPEAMTRLIELYRAAEKSYSSRLLKKPVASS
jgi:tetratricopeptide (TPR) repeat protein